MPTLTSVLAAFFLVLGISAPAISGSCQDKDGMVFCTDDVGQDKTLRSFDRALGNPTPYSPPTLYPDALNSYPSDIKTIEEKRSERRKDDDTEKLSVERPGIEKDKR